MRREQQRRESVPATSCHWALVGRRPPLQPSLNWAAHCEEVDSRLIIALTVAPQLVHDITSLFISPPLSSESGGRISISTLHSFAASLSPIAPSLTNLHLSPPSSSFCGLPPRLPSSSPSLLDAKSLLVDVVCRHPTRRTAPWRRPSHLRPPRPNPT